MAMIRDLMTTNPRIVGPDESARNAARMLASGDIGGVIVCDGDGHLEGMVTDRDLAIGILAEGRDPETHLSELLSGRRVVTIDADDTTDMAMEMMKSEAVRRLPVLENDRVIGILSQADLAAHTGHHGVGDMVQAISTAPDNTSRG